MRKNSSEIKELHKFFTYLGIGIEFSYSHIFIIHLYAHLYIYMLTNDTLMGSAIFSLPPTNE